LGEALLEELDFRAVDFGFLISDSRRSYSRDF
jgi:hypothetical protein